MSLHSKLFALCFALLSAFLFATPAAAQQPPNIVFVMVDDLDVAVWDAALGERGVDEHGVPRPKGPNLLPKITTHLIDKGTTFKQMFVTQSLCCPSRATFLTGQYSQNHGVVKNEGYDYDYIDVNMPDFKSEKEPHALASWLNPTRNAEGKYRTGYFGKYLNDSGKDSRWIPAGWEIWRALVPTKDTSVTCMYGYALANTGALPDRNFGTLLTERDEGNYQTNKIAELAEGFINSSDSRPFMLVVAPMAPHAEDCNRPLDNPLTKRVRTSPWYDDHPQPHTTIDLPVKDLLSYNEDDVKDKPTWIRNIEKAGKAATNNRKAYFNEKVASLRPVDDMVGRLVNALGTRMDNTLFVFTSDNGFQYGTHRLNTKEDFYEESIRVPMVVRGPGQTQKRTQQSWVLNNDWAPTITEYAQVTASAANGPIDGRSFKDLVESESATNGRKTFMVRSGANPGAIAARERQATDHVPFLMVRTRDGALTGDPSESKVMVYAETYDDTVTTTRGYEPELYDLSTDLIQEKSKHCSGTNPCDDAQRQQIAKFRKRLMLLKDCKGSDGVLNDCKSLEN